MPVILVSSNIVPNSLGPGSTSVRDGIPALKVTCLPISYREVPLDVFITKL